MIRTMSAFAAALAATVVPSMAQPASPEIVRTDGGIVRGKAADGVESWKGIPFAAPPVGPLRWRAPQPPASWNAIRDASAYGHDCMQLPFSSDAAPLGTPPAEDCLYLNIWRPAGAARRLPVIVWIYGGGFVNGGSSPPTYAGANLARRGVVFVSFNYRVGRFGTFAHPQLTRENPDKGLLGNYGYMDQIAALRWVRRNIAGFGGDPARVTIMGESAGGMSVHALVTSPMAQGLFARAVVMSGGDGAGMGDGSLVSAEAAGVAFARSKGIVPDDGQALVKLRALPAEAVVDGLNLASVSAREGPRTYSPPFADGVVAVDVAPAYRAGRFAHVPMMIGATSDDIGGPTGYMVAGARRMAAMIADQGVPLYEYRFSYTAPAVRTAATRGASHASDIPFFFDTQGVKQGAATTTIDDAVGRTISSYIVNFARTGAPNGAGLPSWPRYARATDRIMDFGADGSAVPGPDPLGTAIDAAVRPASRP